jgi:hypothetical protein
MNTRYGTCHWNYYEITYVDELNTIRCYATRNLGVLNLSSYPGDMLTRSLELNQTMDEYFKSLGWNCYEEESLGSFYCLKDKSKCLMLEDNDKICTIFNLEGKK